MFMTRLSKPAQSAKKSKQDDQSLAAIEALFQKYVDEDDPDSISMDGISKLSEDIGIDPSSDIRLLVLLWRLGASSKPGIITKTEFINGFRNLQLDSIDGIKNILPSLDPGFLDRAVFRGELISCHLLKSCNFSNVTIRCRILQVRVFVFTRRYS